MLLKINQTDKTGMMEAIKEYIKLHYGVVRAPLACNIQQTITVQTYGDYPMYATTDDKMIIRMLHLPSDKNKMHNEQSAQSVTEPMTENEIDTRIIYDILYQICKDTDLYP